MDSTLDKRIAAMRGSLMDTALEAAESRGQRLAGVAHTLYALYRDDGFAGRLLRAHGLESAEIRLLMGMVPNMPLADGGKPVPNLSTRRILKHANDTLEVLRYLQGQRPSGRTARLAWHRKARPPADAGAGSGRGTGGRRDRRTVGSRTGLRDGSRPPRPRTAHARGRDE